MSLDDHDKKFGEMAHKLGWEGVKALIPLPLSKIRAALEQGDEYLNTWGNRPWDTAVMGYDPNDPGTVTCHCCGSKKPRVVPRHGCDGAMADLFRKARMGHSQSDGVCVLKHVARIEARLTIPKE